MGKRGRRTASSRLFCVHGSDVYRFDYGYEELVMARDNPNPTFRTIPPFKAYAGLTALQTGPTTELVALGLGPEVEAMLVAKAREIGRG